jgi:hypothetical protein
MFGSVVVFAPGAPSARYDLFQLDDNGNLADLQVSATPAFGPLVQFRIQGAPVAVLASAPRRRAKVGTKRRAAKTKTKRKTAKKKGTRTTRASTGARKTKRGSARAGGAQKSRPRRRGGR